MPSRAPRRHWRRGSGARSPAGIRSPARLRLAILRKGCTPQAKQISDLKTLPMPAMTRWLSRTLPTSSSPCSSSSRSGFIRGKLLAQYIGSQPGHAGEPLQRARGVKAGHRHIESDGHQIGCAEHDPHVAAGALPPLAHAIDVPAAAHQHVGGEDEIAGEMDEQPFAARLHLLDRAAGHRALVVHAGQRRIRGLKQVDRLTGKRLVQSAGGAKDGIAFRHWESATAQQCAH